MVHIKVLEYFGLGLLVQRCQQVLLFPARALPDASAVGVHEQEDLVEEAYAYLAMMLNILVKSRYFQ